PMITPPPRRRIHKLARETATLDLLSRGRVVFGAGLGSNNSGEFSKFGEEADPKARAALLDDGLAELQRYWDGAFLPKPAHRIPLRAGTRVGRSADARCPAEPTKGTRAELTVSGMNPVTLSALELVRVGDDRYDEARLAWNLTVDQRPAAVAVPRDADQVVAA